MSNPCDVLITNVRVIDPANGIEPAQVIARGDDLGHCRNGLCVSGEHLVTAKAATHQLCPAIMGELAGEKPALPAQRLALCVDIVHELVDQRDGNLLHLTFGIGHLADQNIPRRINPALRLCVQHSLSFFGHKKHFWVMSHKKHKGHKREVELFLCFCASCGYILN